MAGGYMGKILRIDLTTRKVSTIKTADYEQWGGGHGMGSAIFWDLCKDKTVSGFDPGNVVTIMTSPLSGTITPAAAGRTEVQGIGVQGYPVEWFTRSNFGGRFAGMLKFAGWDGVVIEGKADKPVWVDIRNDDVQIRSAQGIWGLDTYETQEEIWRRVTGGREAEWTNLGNSRDSGRSTQKPAVLTIGRAGENMSRTGSLIHDAGNGAGQGGFGGVWGSKNLKAISVLGSGGVPIADIKKLMEARTWSYKYAVAGHWESYVPSGIGSMFASNPGHGAGYGPLDQPSGAMGCTGCHKGCRKRFATGRSNENQCVDYLWYSSWDTSKHAGQGTQHMLDSADLMQRAGINAYQLEAGFIWLNHLWKQGILGKGKAIHTDLNFDNLGDSSFAKEVIDAILNRTDIGKELHNGLALAAKAWGRYEQDTKTGILPLQEWGYPHHYDARTEVEWGYGSLIGDRDINEHDFNMLVYWAPSVSALLKSPDAVSAKTLSEIMAEKLLPFKDPKMMDYSDEGIYAESMAKLVAWHRYYTRYYKQSLAFCDWAYGDFWSPYTPDGRGLTPEAEPKFFNAVTGKNQTFEQGIEIGRKIWNLDRAVWVLQGRHRDMEVFTDYNFEVGAVPGYSSYEVPYVVPAFENGQWKYKDVSGRKLDRAKLEEWKTRYYTLEGWDAKTGWPTRNNLEALGMGKVAEELDKAGKLGK